MGRPPLATARRVDHHRDCAPGAWADWPPGTRYAALPWLQEHCLPWSLAATLAMRHPVGASYASAARRPQPQEAAVAWRQTGQQQPHCRCGFLAGPEAADLLGRHGALLGLSPDFIIYDHDDQLQLSRRCLVELQLDPQTVPPQAVRQQLDRWKNTGQGPEAVPQADLDPLTAKGLGFPVVFLPALEEERRHCYVGLTRAKQVLYLSAARLRRLYGKPQ